MSDILNLALKKDVYEGINSGTTNKIIIEWSNWWNKRLKDIDTGKFKDFDTVRISCGSAIKLEYSIENIEQINRDFVITVGKQSCGVSANDVQENEDVSEINDVENQLENTDNIEQHNDLDVDISQEGDEYINSDASEDKETDDESDEDKETDDESDNSISQEGDEYINSDTNIDVSESNEDNNINLIDSINSILDDFCENNNVYVINAPVIRILPDGKIIGSSKKLIVDRDCETRLPFEYIEIVKYKTMTDLDFLSNLNLKLNEYLTRKYYVFINRNICGFTKRGSGEDVLVLRLTARKSYIIGR